MNNTQKPRKPKHVNKKLLITGKQFSNCIERGLTLRLQTHLCLFYRHILTRGAKLKSEYILLRLECHLLAIASRKV